MTARHVKIKAMRELGANLGSIARFASDALEKGELADQRRIERFILKATARGLSPDHRVRDCGRKIVYGKDYVELRRNPTGTHAVYANLQRCKSIWDCADCAALITEERRKELGQALANWREGNQVVMLTYTLSHRLTDPLEDTLEILTEARRFMKSGEAWQTIQYTYNIVGSISALEVTWGSDNGWHPHCHELVFIKWKRLNGSFFQSFQSDLQERWLHALDLKGGKGLKDVALDVQKAYAKVNNYVAKMGLEDDPEPEPEPTWNVEHELTKLPVKQGRDDKHTTPRGLLWAAFNGNKMAGELWREYSVTFFRKKQLFWSRGLADLLGVKQLKDDDDIVNDVSDACNIFALFDWGQWARIVHSDDWGRLRVKMLQCARDNDLVRLNELLAPLGISAGIQGEV